jgi:hypothetical protein
MRWPRESGREAAEEHPDESPGGKVSAGEQGHIDCGQRERLIAPGVQ